MDLSNISTADLQALKAGDLSKVSTEGLQELRAQHLAPTPQPGVNVGPVPEGPSGLQHLEDVAGTFIHHPLTSAIGLGENALSGVTGAVVRTGKRLAGSQITGDEGYQPRTEAGKEFAAEGGAEGSAIGNAYDAAAGTGPYASQLKENIGKAGDLAATVGVLDPAIGLASRVPRALGAASEAVNAPKAASIPTAVQRQVQRGIEISPSSVQEAQPATAEAVPGQQTESALEGPDAQRTRVLKNAATNNTHINTDLGINDTGHTTPADIDEARGIGPDGKVQTMRQDPRTGEARETDLSVYNRVANAAHGQPVGANTATSIGDALAHTEASSDAAVNTVGRMVKTYQNRYQPGATIDGAQIQGDISTLRQRYRKGMASPDLDQQDIGVGAKRIADSLEDEMVSHADPNSQLASDFRAARQHLAQLNDAETALKGGSYDPAVLQRLKDKGQPLSGSLKDVAEASEIAPGDVMHPQKAPPPSTEAYTLSNLAHKTGALVGRGLNRVTGGTNNAAEAVARHVPPAPEPPGVPPGSLTPPPGNVGPEPAQGEMGLKGGEAPATPFSLEHAPGQLPEAIHPQHRMQLPPGHGAAAHARMSDIFNRARGRPETPQPGIMPELGPTP